MNHHHTILRLSILCLLAGCSANAADEPGAEPRAEASSASALIESSVSATLGVQGGSACKPLGFPLTAFATGAFGVDALIEESASATPDGRCLHEQTLAAPASAWASFSYDVMCHGGGDTRLCGAASTRHCSVDLLMRLTAKRSEPVTLRDPLFGFAFEVPPQSAAATAALQDRAQLELETFLDETEIVMSELADGQRDCPDESGPAIEAMYDEALELSR